MKIVDVTLTLFTSRRRRFQLERSSMGDPCGVRSAASAQARWYRVSSSMEAAPFRATRVSSARLPRT
jgi:hypothetical protein